MARGNRRCRLPTGRQRGTMNALVRAGLLVKIVGAEWAITNKGVLYARRYQGRSNE